jgi:parvulin-like peptidyl-prolyl isomerase
MNARWLILTITASLAFGTPLFAQAPKAPPTPALPAVGGSSGNIIPVSYSNEQVAATVNGEKIFVGDIRKLLDRQPYPLSLTEAQKKEIRSTVLDSLVEDALMRHYLAKNVPQVSQTDFNKAVAELQEALKKLNKTYEAFLKEEGQSEEQLRRDIIARLQWKNILLRMLPDDKAKAYYDANKIFFDKVEVRASHIMIQLPDNASKEQRDAAAQKLLVLRQEIAAGKATFEDLAKQHSDCVVSKGKGGDIGKFPYKFIVYPEFSSAAFAMKVGDISGVVTTAKGVHLIKVTERTPGVASNFELIKEAVREIWAQDENLIPRILAEQRKLGDIRVSLQ